MDTLLRVKATLVEIYTRRLWGFWRLLAGLGVAITNYGLGRQLAMLKRKLDGEAQGIKADFEQARDALFGRDD